MTAVWMLASSFVAVLLACAALALTRTVALYRDVSLRWLWTLATLASVVVALLWLRPKPSPAPVSVRATALTWSAPATSSAPVIRVEPVVLAPARIWSVVTLSAVPRTFERALFTIWACASLVLALLLASAAMRLRMERRGWVWREVANTRVLVSKAFGPALVSVHRPTIVLPKGCSNSTRHRNVPSSLTKWSIERPAIPSSCSLVSPPSC